MELIKTTNREYHENGNIKYIETIAVIPPLFSVLYNKGCIGSDGVHRIRVGKCQKTHDNGVIAWTLNYNDKGDVIKENNISKRRDGTIINY